MNGAEQLAAGVEKPDLDVLIAKRSCDMVDPNANKVIGGFSAYEEGVLRDFLEYDADIELRESLVDRRDPLGDRLLVRSRKRSKRMVNLPERHRCSSKGPVDRAAAMIDVCHHFGAVKRCAGVAPVSTCAAEQGGMRPF